MLYAICYMLYAMCFVLYVLCYMLCVMCYVPCAIQIITKTYLHYQLIYRFNRFIILGSKARFI